MLSLQMYLEWLQYKHEQSIQTWFDFLFNWYFQKVTAPTEEELPPPPPELSETRHETRADKPTVPPPITKTAAVASIDDEDLPPPPVS